MTRNTESKENAESVHVNALSSQRPQESDYGYAMRRIEHMEEEHSARQETVSALVKSCKELLGFVEMKLAHTSTQSVEQIEQEIERVRNISHVSTGHHIGCARTTRSVDLNAARSAIVKAQISLATDAPLPNVSE